MARTKFDGVIEAVRYDPEGNISVARGYERRGAVWSDQLIISRRDLVERLKTGKRYVTGIRKTYVGSEFDTGPSLLYKNDHVLTDSQSASRDMLAGVSIF